MPKAQVLRMLVIVVLVLNGGAIDAATPELFSAPFHQSPVHGDPGDLVFIAGAGFESGGDVVYVLFDGTSTAPTVVPGSNTSSEGVATIELQTADNLTVKLPSVITEGEIYELWVRNSGTTWAGPLLINDARPLWFTPARAYETDDYAGLPRELKVVGRNLQPLPGASTEVRLTPTGGGTATTLTASTTAGTNVAIDTYVARVTLPSSMTADTYDVEVNKGDDRWIAVPDRTFEVLDDPPSPSTFNVHGPGCKSNDAKDDTQCVLDAIADAESNGGGEVYFKKGTWLLGDDTRVTYGIVVPQGVSLRGQSVGNTVVERSASWDLDALFILMGQNKVSNIHFDDATTYDVDDNTARDRTFQVGLSPSQSGAGDPTVIEDLIITGNRFDNMCFAFHDGNYPIEHAYFVDNVFQPFRQAIHLGGNRYITDFEFDIRDSVIVDNTFYPGDYLAPEFNGGQGAIASEIGAGTRLDLSDNLTDGRVNGGFRAGHFWHMNGSHEMLLISNNDAYCTGDKAGDGEAFIFDENANTVAFDFALMARDATSTSVKVEGTLLESASGYYKGHWVQISGGTGIGQNRRVTGVSESGGEVTFNVTPAWDVEPDDTSLVTVSRVFWQAAIVDNFVDSREPQCGKSNLTEPRAGIIGFAAPTSDSAIESNEQHDTDGIRLYGLYSSFNDQFGPLQNQTIISRMNFDYFNHVRDNEIYGEYAFDDPASDSGIHLNWGSTPEFCSPTFVYGLSIDGNTVEGADARRGGGIAVQWGWYRPESNDPLRNILIYGNSISEIERDSCVGADEEWEGIGIHVVEDPDGPNPDREVVWDVVMDGNTITNVCTDVVDYSCTTGAMGCTVECRLDDCPTVSPCLDTACEQASEVSATDQEERVCQGGDDTQVCPPGETWHIVEYSCTKADCCFEMPACLCPIGACPNGEYLECR